jgi:hypothetical protein
MPRIVKVLEIHLRNQDLIVHLIISQIRRLISLSINKTLLLEILIQTKQTIGMVLHVSP